MRSKIIIILFCIISIFIYENRYNDWKNQLIHWDQVGYNLYLPALITYQDLDSLNFYPKKQQQYQFTPGNTWSGIYQQPTGKRVNKYPTGVAIHQLPFFLVAQMVANNTKGVETNGYSIPYQYAIIISTFFWIMIGLILLRSTLRQYYSDGVVAITLLAIVLGTNLYYYNIFFPGMSHTYAFFHFSSILYLSDKLYHSYKRKYILLLGLMLGVATITRPTNLLAVLIPTLWGVYSIPTLINKIKNNLNAKRIGHLLAAGIIFMLVVLIQLSYWKYTTGSWIYYSYENEGFVWSDPAIIKGLFSFRKGWFVYTPLAIFMVAGLILFYKKNKHQYLAISVFMLFFIYVTFCWWNWWYGGGFGARTMIDTYALLSLPLAAMVSYISRQKIVFRIASAAVLVFFIILNMFQSFQLSENVLDYENTTREYYFKIFFKTKRPQDADEYLITNEEYYREVQQRLNNNKE